MTLVKAWEADYSSQATVPWSCNLSQPGNHAAFWKEQQWTLYNGYSHTPYGVPAEMWRDTNHLPRQYIYNVGILRPSTFGAPPRVHPVSGDTINGLDLYGGEMHLRMLGGSLYLTRRSQIGLLMQWYDPEALNGLGAHVNYILKPRDGKTIDEHMGFLPANERHVTGQELNTAWHDIVLKFEADDPATSAHEDESSLIPLHGRPDKVASLVYGTSDSARAAYLCQLANLQIVIYTGTALPNSREPAAGNIVEPMTRYDGPGSGWGQLYIADASLHVNPALNPNL